MDLGLKTPLAFLLLVAAGIAGRRKDAQNSWPGMWGALASAAGILLVATIFGNINLGIRHILPVYSGLSIVAAEGLLSLMRRQATRALAAALAIWLVAGSALAHPDYLAYFNELAGSRPERILIDSDLDWGQDVQRLGKRLADAHATQVGMLNFASLPRGVGLYPFSLDAPQPGWNAANITPLTIATAQAGERDPHRTFWFDRLPAERIGKGILLWWVAPASGGVHRTPG